jgi:Flp pilus assembly protein protease CpaA
MNSQIYFDLASSSLTVLMLGIGAYQDIKRREVDDWVWFIAVPAAALNVYRLATDTLPIGPVEWGAELALLSAMAIGFYYAGLFGGADAKALVAVGAALPSPMLPFHSQIILLGLTVFDNGVVLAVLYSALFTVRNLLMAAFSDGYLGRYSQARFKTKFGLMLSAYKTNVGEYLKSSYKLFLAEIPQTDPNGRVHFEPLFKVHLAFDDDIEAGLAKLVEQGSVTRDQEIWVSPGLPLVTFMFLGLILTYFLGDVVFRVVSLFA